MGLRNRTSTDFPRPIPHKLKQKNDRRREQPRFPSAAVDSIIPTRIGFKPGAKGSVDLTRVPAVIRRLKQQDWALNPFAFGDDNHQFLKGRLMKVVKGIMGKQHAGRVSDMTEDSFWSVLTTLVRGKVKNVQMRAK